MVINSKDWFQKLKERFPDGIVLGSARAIVGQFGLRVCCHNKDGSKSEKRYCEGRMLSITEIKGEILEVADAFPHAHIHYKHFKGVQIL